MLSGAAAVGQLESNLAALRVAWDGEAAEQLRAVVEPAQAYWATRSRLPWN